MRPTGPRSQVTLICNRCGGEYPFQIPASGFGNTPHNILRGVLKTYISLRRIDAEVILGQWLAALLVVVMMLQHYTRFVPFPEGAPTRSADSACRPDQLQCPRRMGLAGSISGNRLFSNGYRHATNLGHCVERNQETGKKRAHSRFSANRFFHGFTAPLDVVGIELVENFKIFFVASCDLSLDDGCV